MTTQPSDRPNLIKRYKNRRPTRRGFVSSRKPTGVVAAILGMALLALMFAGLSTSAQSQPQQQSASANSQDDNRGKNAAPGNNSASNVWVVSQDDYYIGPSDVLTVKIEDAPELSQSYTVSVAGFIEMQVIGKLLAVNKTPDQLAASIREALIKADYLKRPRISVNVTEYNSRTFFIHGSVHAAGAYKIRGKVTILDLIVLAGGMMENHGPNAFIIRRKQRAPMTTDAASVEAVSAKQTTAAEAAMPVATTPATTAATEVAADNQDYEMIRANINGLERGRFSQNITLLPGDVVNIPALNVFFIGGEVNAPGSFPLKEGTTLRQAITLAQGTTFKAARSRAVIFRGNNEDGKQLEITVDIDAVMSGKKSDILLQADDLVVVPSSRMRSIGGTILQGFGMTTIQRGIIR
ncbi:MAG: SLBB domain-containing protein [Acidobacteria bacterium]|nr:SLBB domain-containing protein [Acidobacteriota bacterium]